MEQPTGRHYNLMRGTTTLYFPGGEFSEYRMRGGVAFPQMYDDRGRLEIRGHIAMSGQDIHTKKIYVFEDTEFFCVEPYLNDEGIVEIHGIVGFVNDCWNKYYENKFYWYQNEEVATKYRLQIARSKLIGKRLVFVEANMADIQSALGILLQYVQMKKIFWKKESIISKEMAGISKDQSKLHPAIHALAVMLAGIEKSPYRER